MKVFAFESRGRRRTSYLAVLMFMAAVGAPPTAALAAGTTFDGGYVTTNPCTGELLEVTGTYRANTVERQDGAGGEHYFAHYVFQGSAIGVDSGSRYRVVTVQMDPGPTHVGATSATTNTDVIIERFVALDSSDGFYAHISHHRTTTPGGEVTATPVVVFTRCA